MSSDLSACCTRPNAHLVAETMCNGIRRPMFQCQTCGAGGRYVRRDQAPHVDDLPPKIEPVWPVPLH